MGYTVKINQRSLKEKVEATFFQQAKSIATKNAIQVIEQRKRVFINDFLSSPITKSIQQGAKPNSGVDGQNGNLFSFIGFEDGSDPIAKLYEFLEESVHAGPHIDYNRLTKTFTFQCICPTPTEIKEETPYPDTQMSGKSWVAGIETGIPGLANYKFYNGNDPRVLGTESRSGTGAQRKNEIHAGAMYQPKPYLLSMLKVLSRKKYL